MIPPSIAVVLLVGSLGCFYYLFRGFTSDDNPALGNLLATGINVVICALFVTWFMNGGIAEPQIVLNATYTVGFHANATTPEVDPSAAVDYISASVGKNIYLLQDNGGGMYTVSSINAFAADNSITQDLTTTEFIPEYSTYDIIYLQYQEKSLSYFFLLLAVINAALFLWFIFGAGWPAVRQFIHGSPRQAGENTEGENFG